MIFSLKEDPSGRNSSSIRKRDAGSLSDKSPWMNDGNNKLFNYFWKPTRTRSGVGGFLGFEQASYGLA